MLSNAYLVITFRFDTAEDEPAKNSQINFAKKCKFCKLVINLISNIWGRGALPRPRAASSADPIRFAKFWQVCQAVKPPAPRREKNRAGGARSAARRRPVGLLSPLRGSASSDVSSLWTRRVAANFWQIFSKLSLVFSCIGTDLYK